MATYSMDGITMPNESNEINVCCPYFRTMPCGDTKEHRHLFCKIVGMINNSDTTFKCISDCNWENCEAYKQRPIKD
jgi:hypothetical protein